MPDVWKAWVGRGRRPDDDRQLILAGGDVGMVFWTHQEDRCPTPGVLVLGTTAAAVESVRAALGDPPYRITSVDRPPSSGVGGPFMSGISGEGAGARWVISVPTADVETFEYVLRALSGRAL